MEVYVDGVLQGGGGGGGGNATSIQGIPVSAAVPTLGQYLGFDGSQWAPTSFPWVWTQNDSVTTTNDTQTTCGTYGAAAGAYVVEVFVGAEEPAADTGVTWQLLAHVTSDGTTATLDGNVVSSSPTTPTTPWSVTLDVVGAAVRVRVTGEAATTINWTASWIIR